jgi:stringent starvation protein B
MTPTRPYLLRALYEWIVDNRCTPHLLVEVQGDDVRVPKQYAENGVIVLNVSPTAVKGLTLGNERITFSARFAGTPHAIDVPVSAVQAIYARENGQGIVLSDAATSAAKAEPSVEPAPTNRAPHLTIVK